ncbi:IS630 family transposase, partial [Clostridium sp. ZS2-4]|uniref:IS630 family transposase n=1 Tax=Clostridium sp. ZS2-4 TaxID=2987703 RepID=UPI00227D2D34
HQGVKLIGTLNYETGEVFCIERERYDAQVFLQFLKMILEKYPMGKIVMILDNTRIHHAKLLEEFLSQNAHRIEFLFLPPYSPNLNFIEGLWKWLKEKVVYNVFYSSVKEIRENVKLFLNEINKNPEAIIQRLCLKL